MPTSLSIYHLVYVSEASAPLSVEELQGLLRQARAYNQDHRITGLLFHSKGQPATSSYGTFLQVLEGEETAVRKVLARVSRDPRNTNVQVLIEGPVQQRMFPDWAMGFMAVIPSDMENLTGYINPSEARFLLPRARAISPELHQLMQSMLAEYPAWPYPFA